MAQRKKSEGPSDWLWQAIRDEAAREAQTEPVLASLLHATVLNHATLEEALSFHLAGKLGSENLPSMLIRDVIDDSLSKGPEIGRAVRADIQAVSERDPACPGYLATLLYYKGFHALQSYRVSHWLWEQGRRSLARHLQNRISELFAVDIHPAARVGVGVFIDHGTGVVIGETAVVEDNVSMLHGVTLGGTGKESGDRHPKVRSEVMIGAGAKILGNVEIGARARIAAGSVVLKDVRAGCTVAGVPAVTVGHCEEALPARDMKQSIEPDPVI
jgi:serine O-acetyltransferase